LIGPVYVIFLLGRGLTFAEIAILESVFMLVILLRDYPTGVFADKYGRRVAVYLAFFFWGAGLGIYAFSSRFFQFVIGEAVAGLGLSFYSGSLNAWMYDVLIEKNREDRSQRYLV
jgi:MFS family permease